MKPVSRGKKRVYTKAEKRMIGKVVHLLCLLGYTLEDGTADKARINLFVKNIGSNNPRKVILPFLFEKELEKVATQVEQMYRKETTRNGE